MLIGIISDTHDNLAGLKKALDIFKERKIEMLIHCGDWVSPFTFRFLFEEMIDFKIPIKSVLGNNIGDVKRIMLDGKEMGELIEWPKKTTFTLELDGRKTIIYHGEDDVLLEALIDRQKYDVIFTGHTHRARNEKIGKTLVINPGSAAYTCEDKIAKKASLAIYDSGKGEAEVVEF